MKKLFDNVDKSNSPTSQLLHGESRGSTSSLPTPNSNYQTCNTAKKKKKHVETSDNVTDDVAKLHVISGMGGGRNLCVLGCCGRGTLSLIWSSSINHGTSNVERYGGGPTTRQPGAVPFPLTQKATAASQEDVNQQMAMTSSNVMAQAPVPSSPANWTASPQVTLNLDDPEVQNGGEKLGRLQFSVIYDFSEMTLTLRIVRAVDLVAKDFSGTSDPYVKILLLPDKKRKLTTNVKRKNLNPRWNEVFAFEGFPHAKLMSRTLYMQVLDYDRFSRDDPIGEICIPLCEFDLTSGVPVWKNLQPCKSHMGKLGEIYIGLCYHPSNGQLNVNVEKARDLKAKDINGLSDPYVKIWYLLDGKKHEKKKTTLKEKTLNPIFKETFAFDVAYDKIRVASLMVSVMDYDRMGRNELIGQVMLGSKSGPMEVKHWNEMFSKPRQEVFQWHILKDFG